MAAENSGHMSKSQSMRRLSNGNVANSVIFADSHHMDAFGKLRVSSPFSIYESKHIYNIDDRRTWETKINGAGASITHLHNESSVKLSVGTADGEYAEIQNGRYNTYVPGRSQHILMTGVFGRGKTNLVQRLGYYDNDNGLFFELNGTTFNIVHRSKVTGTVVETRIPQSEWNADRLDGSKLIPSNPSFLTLDITKAQIFVIDFQWLGVGRIRFGFVIGSAFVFCHELSFANSIESVHMTTPDLPLKSEIFNDGATASSSFMKQICVSVQSEGGVDVPGYEFSANNGPTTRTATTAGLPVLAIRMKETYGDSGKVNRVVAQILSAQFFTNSDALFEILHLHNPTIVGGAWLTTSADDSAVEYNSTMTSFSAADIHPINSKYVSAATGTSKAETDEASLAGILSRHNFIFRNAANTGSAVILIRATPFTGTAGVAAAINWVEIY